MTSSTFSFRIDDELRARLEAEAQASAKGKNWIINRAIEEYLDAHSRERLREEARRQSLRAASLEGKDQALWERLADETWSE